MVSGSISPTIRGGGGFGIGDEVGVGVGTIMAFIYSEYSSIL